jgi:enoyl-CoA hydratase
LALAKELILTGDHVDAARALRSGVVSAVAPADQLQATAIAYAQRILSRGPLAIRMAKLAMNASSQAPLHAGLVVERLAQAICFGSTDKAEGTRAFLEKRQPDFKGR